MTSPSSTMVAARCAVANESRNGIKRHDQIKRCRATRKTKARITVAAYPTHITGTAIQRKIAHFLRIKSSGLF